MARRMNWADEYLDSLYKNGENAVFPPEKDMNNVRIRQLRPVLAPD